MSTVTRVIAGATIFFEVLLTFHCGTINVQDMLFWKEKKHSNVNDFRNIFFDKRKLEMEEVFFFTIYIQEYLGITN